MYTIDPLSDPRWDALERTHPYASVFHTRGWLLALKRTYNYQPVAFTTSPPGEELANALLFCHIDSWLNGRRLVSLPFSDYCAPLVEKSEDARYLSEALEEGFRSEKVRYIEMRSEAPHMVLPAPFGRAKVFWLHTLDLRPGIDDLFRSFHKDCVQRKIRRAERERLTYEVGNSGALLDKFWQLLLLTRRKHGLPPQPIQWFQNLIDCLGDKLRLHIACKDGQPVASVLTISHREVLVYKYSVSDPRLRSLGGTQFLLWRAILEAKGNQVERLDMGRSDCDNQGLIRFKERWRATRSPLVYWRCPMVAGEAPYSARANQAAKLLFGHMPEWLLTTVGSVFYKHVG